MPHTCIKRTHFLSGDAEHVQLSGQHFQLGQSSPSTSVCLSVWAQITLSWDLSFSQSQALQYLTESKNPPDRERERENKAWGCSCV